MVNWVDASALGPKADSFHHELECLTIVYMVQYVLTGNTSEQTILRVFTQVWELLRFGDIGLFEHFVDTFRFIHQGKENVELDIIDVNLDYRHLSLRYRNQVMKVFLALNMLHEARLKCVTIDILLFEDKDDIYVSTWTMHS